MRLLSLFLIFISQWIFSASDQGNITVNGETVEVSVERFSKLLKFYEFCGCFEFWSLELDF